MLQYKGPRIAFQETTDGSGVCKARPQGIYISALINYLPDDTQYLQGNLYKANGLIVIKFMQLPTHHVLVHVPRC